MKDFDYTTEINQETAKYMLANPEVKLCMGWGDLVTLDDGTQMRRTVRLVFAREADGTIIQDHLGRYVIQAYGDSGLGWEF